MSGLAGTNAVVQVGFVVKDIYETKKKWAQFLGVEEPPVGDSGEYAVTRTQYKGEEAPGAKSLLAFFNFPGFQIELIQPNEEPSTWREFLDTHGEGMHHLAFEVGGMRMEQAAKLLKSHPDMRVFEVATRTGFLSDKHFISVFKKYYGVSPAMYQKSQASHRET